MPAVLFTNVSPFRLTEMLAACSHMPYRIWAEKQGDSFDIMVDKECVLPGREASGDARGARRKPQARAAPRGPGSNPGRSTTTWWGGKKT